jgi:hypothetical protein
MAHRLREAEPPVTTATARTERVRRAAVFDGGPVRGRVGPTGTLGPL